MTTTQMPYGYFFHLVEIKVPLGHVYRISGWNCHVQPPVDMAKKQILKCRVNIFVYTANAVSERNVVFISSLEYKMHL